MPHPTPHLESWPNSVCLSFSILRKTGLKYPLFPSWEYSRMKFILIKGREAPSLETLFPQREYTQPSVTEHGEPTELTVFPQLVGQGESS